jgi:cytochrome oxidase Cu insertion factor (SCO1/SenC/PrrC family)
MSRRRAALSIALAVGSAFASVAMAEPATAPPIAATAPPVAATAPPEPSAVELIEGLLSGKAPVGGPFALTDHAGRPRTDTDFRGKLVVLYFGYTSCPDVCPTELQSITLALDKLGAAADRVQPLFITIDPERDTPSRLADFISAFDPRFVALTGELPAIRKAALAYRVYFAKPAVVAQNYPVDHTGFIYLVGADGRYAGFLPPGLSPDEIADAIRARLPQGRALD